MEKRGTEQLRRFNIAWANMVRVYADFYDMNRKVLYYILEQEENGTEAVQKELCDIYRANKQTVNMAVNRLEREGFLYRKESDTDKRKKILVLTEKGRKYGIEEVLPLKKAETKAFLDMPEEEVEQMLASMEQFIENLKTNAMLFFQQNKEEK